SDSEQLTGSDIENMNSGNETVKTQIHQQLSYVYPYQEAMVKPSKQSVSEVKRQLETEQADTNYDRVRQYHIGTTTYERPAFLSNQTKRKENEVGTLMHTVMQYLTFKQERLTLEEIEAFVEQLIVKSIIPKDAKADIQFEDIHKFVES